MNSNLTKKEEQLLKRMENTFIRVGYCDSGAIIPLNIAEREVLQGLVKKGYIEKRGSNTEMYQLKKATREKLTIKHGLIKAWGKKAEGFLRS